MVNLKKKLRFPLWNLPVVIKIMGLCLVRDGDFSSAMKKYIFFRFINGYLFLAATLVGENNVILPKFFKFF